MLNHLFTQISRRSLARILSTFLCALCVVIRPISNRGGPYVFLVLSLKELVFSVQEDLAQQIEITILNISGALLGIGISTFARFLSTKPHQNSAASRSIPAIFLVAISFFAGWIKSRLPRLQLSARISCFISIWMLTANPGASSNPLSDAGHYLWITLTAAAICLFSSVLILHWSPTHLVEQVSATLAGLCTCLSVCMEYASPSQSADIRGMHMALVQRSVTLNEVYSQAAFELRVGRVNVKYLKPLVGILEHLRRELSWGMSSSNFSNMSHRTTSCPTALAFEKSAHELAKTISTSFKSVENLVTIVFARTDFRRRSLRSERDAVVAGAIQLNLAWYTMQDELRNLIRSAIDERSPQAHMPRNLYQRCLFATALLQMAYDTSHTLQVVQRIASHHEASPLRLWHPRLSLQWLGVAHRSFVVDDHGVQLDNDGAVEPDTTLSADEVRQGIASFDEPPQKHEKDGMNYFCVVGTESNSVSKHFQHRIRRPSLLLSWLWNHPRTLRARLGFSKIVRDTQHSSHLRHALKNAAGVAFLSFPAFLPETSAGSRWFRSDHGQWLIISYVWVLEPNTGATWRVGYLRLSGTVLGAIYAYITWAICRGNPYGIVIMLTLFDVLATWLIVKSNVPSLGVVASVTLPPIVLAQYINADPNVSTLKIAVLRGLMIAFGIIAALAMNSLIFPRHSRVLFLNDTSRTLGILSQLYLLLTRGMFHEFSTFTPYDKRQILKLELQIRDALPRLESLIRTMGHELSLVPKPMRHYRQVVQKLQKILDLMTGLRKIREKIPRKETVASVLKERREFVSCICIALFASEHVFRSRKPLPQFLPSSRQALENLVTQVEQRIQIAIENDHSFVGLSVVYSFAEREVMHDLVDTVEELLELCRQLFGTSAWLTYTLPTIHSDDGPGTPGEGWYSTLGRM
ncbi:Fusaric acid resistance protein-like-domain-containing protein [Hygrophoropsis aurantiaca]|uniref:Fusaric acid resistance protein-like-domain-containing protein n=1 Tax=Hygrophoropsis aurantiaca TaxID=72124 RepID=A0ACB8A3T0_9AGAM|nr:Fusaric acid resistance protein-like-domain-containing protein [Hygrophoropsis aurantiaca]